jgi:TonB family protein
MRLAILLFCGAFAFGQSTSPTPEPKAQPPVVSSDPKQQDIDSGPVTASVHPFEFMDILRYPGSVDFGPYVKLAQQRVRENWSHLIPESSERKKGNVAIQLILHKDGQVSAMKLVLSSGDVALDRPAWDSITESKPFPALPSDYALSYLGVRFRFYYNPDKSENELAVAKPGEVGEVASDPKVISQVDPEFSEQARKAKFQGLCALSIFVEPDGTPSNIRVTSSLGMGLDEKAIEAVKKWRFQPSIKDGHPARYGPVEVDVDFHLYTRPTR